MKPESALSLSHWKAHMNPNSYVERRGKIEDYFDRTAVQVSARLTSDAPVGCIWTTVRAGRDRMRATLLGWLPADLTGLRVLEAGCGTGALAVEAARRGAQVLGSICRPHWSIWLATANPLSSPASTA